ncbi:predicted protein [Thalassiosira pseudonana CCMP1335]|uniref:Uncharacterized protein n=1 Tax=Thalassiosira pseudonana TaxID=35128 RepID=B8LEL0_THAPS|nr:predicted protein [Thalassiosira pseudonana CCMP1335]EED86235.1 predicted protein [Thalassiosira pseudonana CCMP1335]
MYRLVALRILRRPFPQSSNAIKQCTMIHLEYRDAKPTVLNATALHSQRRGEAPRKLSEYIGQLLWRETDTASMGRVGTNLVALDPCDDAGFEEYPKLEDFRVTAIPNKLLWRARNFRE